MRDATEKSGPSVRRATKKQRDGRQKRSKNYTSAETTKLLDIIAEEKPSGSNEWHAAYNIYREWTTVTGYPSRDCELFKQKVRPNGSRTRTYW